MLDGRYDEKIYDKIDEDIDEERDAGTAEERLL